MASPYEILGVPPTADAATLRAAYRRLAQRHHPDRNPGDASSVARFQSIQEAYTRACAALDARSRPPDPVWEAFNDIFGDMLRRSQRREASLAVMDIRVPLDSLLRDTAHVVTIGAGKSRLVVPAGAPEGMVVPLDTPIGTTSHVRVFSHPHPVFRRDRQHLSSPIELTLSQMFAGGRTMLQTLAGPAPVMLPELLSPGQVVALRGQGLPDGAGGRGDWFATVVLRMPPALTRQQAEALRAWEASVYAPPEKR